MLPLTEISQWKKLSSAFNNSEEIPELLQKLSETFDIDLMIEITTEYISHQMSLYEVTFAVFPYLIELIEKTEDHEFKLETFLYTMAMFSEYGGDEEMDFIFLDSKCDPEKIVEIKNTFNNSFGKLNQIAVLLELDILKKDEYDKRHFLTALAVSNRIFEVSSVLWRYSENEEYICTCPSCGESLTLWNENDRLVQYKEDPVFVKDQEKFSVEPAVLSKAEYSKAIISEKNYQWLSYYIDKFEVESLRVIINYLFGKTICGYCYTKFEIFENIE
ncbi:uncharacterized protein CHSO_2445 [Chryseobacterium sp. StRB126]|uniref:hypothetical protein n=1 Tax=Chryseobacterium sp. StRB126 TaxID=878220 RepID=UPI0004E98774|nr:hypothetical protein [Chryseobacterium sp. StRB126]BAP31482.1 uncharacterized protein CHSO_2445 [Chryseobacterium sp. StRB126]